MPTVNIHAAKTQFSRLVDEAASGVEIIIAKAGKPVAKLSPLTTAEPRPKQKLGALTGLGVVPENFDAPLPDAMLDAFEGR